MKKWLLRIVLGFVGLVVLLYGFVFLRSALPASVNDGGLKLVRADVPAGENAFEPLQSAIGRIWRLENQGESFLNLVRDTNWNGQLATTLLEKNREALAAWDAAVKMPDLQVPEIADANTELPYLAGWKELAQLAAIRQNSLMHQGSEKEAFDQMVGHIQLARRMQNSGGNLIGYLVGIAVEAIGLNQFQHWVGHSRLSAKELKVYIRRLDFDSGDAAAALANVFKAEYHSTIGNINLVRDGKIINPESGGYYPRPTPFWPAFNYSRTRAMFADAFGVLVKTAPLHYSELKNEYRKNATKLPGFEQQPHPVFMILSGNATGEVLYYLMIPAVLKTHEKKCRANVQLHATRTILALRAYQLTHGKLPPDLNALVPEFLPRVPVDDYDGQPLRYSAAQKIVYSVGKNLKDDGGDDRGSEAPESERHLDLGFKFDF